jgi:hypothetical protein
MLDLQNLSVEHLPNPRGFAMKERRPFLVVVLQ